MQEKPFYVHIELHKKVVKNAWIISYEERKILVIEFQETVTEDESVAYVFTLAKSLVSEKNTKELRASGDRIFGEYKVEEIDRKLSRKTDFELLLEFEFVCDRLLDNGKGKK